MTDLSPVLKRRIRDSSIFTGDKMQASYLNIYQQLLFLIQVEIGNCELLNIRVFMIEN